MRLEGRIAAVTGGGAGIGPASFPRLAAAGGARAAPRIPPRAVPGHNDALRGGLPPGAGRRGDAPAAGSLLAGHPHYSAAKSGILGFTRSVAKELIVQGIRVNAVAPGFIDTTRMKGELDAGRRAQVARTPAGRLGTPEEVAATVAFLASDDAAY